MLSPANSASTRDERLRAQRARRRHLAATPTTRKPWPPSLRQTSHRVLEESVDRATRPAGSGEPPRRLLTLEEAGKILRVGRTTAWELVHSGELSAVRIRGKLLIPCEEPERYLAELLEDARSVSAARRLVRRRPSKLVAGPR
jgi:excisionase family DNA binding protein